MAKIYLSSTFEDLKTFRKSAYAQLRRSRHDVLSMEDYNAAGRRPLDKCLEDVRAAEIYVGIFAWRYGYVPKTDNPAQKSITELELEQAERAGKQVIIFLVDKNASWPPAFMDTHTGNGDNGQQIKRLRQRLQDAYMCGFFTTPDQLAAAISPAIEEARLALAVDRTTSIPSPQLTTPADDGTHTGFSHVRSRQWARKLAQVMTRSAMICGPDGRVISSGVLLPGRALDPKLPDETLVITANHVISDTAPQTGAAATGALVRYARGPGATDGDMISTTITRPLWESSVGDLDITIAQLADPPQSTGQDVQIADPRKPVTAVSRHDEVVVIGHPMGRSATFAMGRNLQQDPTKLYYTAETEPGSSGSGVYDYDLELMALHRLRGADNKSEGTLLSAVKARLAAEL